MLFNLGVKTTLKLLIMFKILVFYIFLVQCQSLTYSRHQINNNNQNDDALQLRSAKLTTSQLNQSKPLIGVPSTGHSLSSNNHINFVRTVLNKPSQRSLKNPITIRSLTRTLSNMVTLRTNNTASSFTSATSVNKKSSDLFSNVKTDREGYSNGYSNSYDHGYNNGYDHYDNSRDADTFKAVDPPASFAAVSLSVPLPAVTLASLPPPPPQPAPVVLNEPVNGDPFINIAKFTVLFHKLPQVQRIVEQVPVPVEVFHAVDRPVPVPVHIVREVPHPVPVDRIVPVDRPVPVPFVQQVPVPEPFPVPFIRNVPVPHPVEVVRHVPIPQPIPFVQRVTVDRPVFIERKVPVPEPVPFVQNIVSVPPPQPLRFAPSPLLTRTIRVEQTSTPLTALRPRFLTTFNNAYYGKFERLLRSASALKNGFFAPFNGLRSTGYKK